MGKKKLLALALEYLVAPATQPAAAAVETVDVVSELSVLESAENAAKDCVSDIAQTQESSMALEALAVSLKSPHAKSMGKMGAMYFNVAAENFMQQARIASQDLPMAAPQMDAEPEAAIAAGQANIVGAINQAAAVTTDDLANLLVELSIKREAMTKLIHGLHHRLDEVKEDLEAIKTGQLRYDSQGQLKELGGYRDYAYIQYAGKGVVQGGSSVAGDLLRVLEDHMAMFQRLVHSQSEWVRQHKDNVMNLSGGIRDYCFDPALYLCAAVQYSHSAPDGEIFHSSDLPGGMRLYCKTGAKEKVFGQEAVEALTQSSVWLAPAGDLDSQTEPNYGAVYAITAMQMEAREKEMRMVLLKLREWSDFVNRDIWAQALFEEAITAMLITPEQGSSVGEEKHGMLRALGAAVVKLCNEASSNLGSELLAVVACMVKLLEDSMRAHVGEHHDVAGAA